jgi:hypothetical protein
MHPSPCSESIYIVIYYDFVDPVVLGDVVHLSLDQVALVFLRVYGLSAVSVPDEPILNGFDVRGHHVDEMAIYVSRIFDLFGGC